MHSKAVLNRDSRVGQAFEALLLNLDVQNYERSLSRSETVERLSSENFLPGVSGGDVFYESTPKDTSPEVKRRAFSMTSNDGGSHDSLGQFAASHAAYHSFTGPPAGAVHVHNNNSAHHIAPASAHYLVSPEVSKYRQRRELRERERDDPKQQLHYSMPNSRSSEHNFNNSLATSHSLPDAPHKQTSQPLPPVSSAAAADSKPSNKAYLTNKEVTPKRSHSLTGDGTSTYVGSVSASSGSSAGRVSEAPTLSGYGNNGSGGDQASGRERVHSFSATEKREQHPSAAEPSSAWSLVSAIFGHAATHASQVRKQRGSYNGSASTSAAEAMPGMGYNKSSTAGAELVNSRSRPQQVARGNRGDDDRESIGTREVVQTQAASSYPPSALLGKLDVSSANREHGFNHVVSLAEVGGVSAPLTIAQVLGTGSSSATIDDAMYNLSGRSNYYNQQGEGTPRCDDSAPPVHCLDVADNLPPQYSLPALLSAFNGARPLQEVLEMWPEPLREYSVEIVVFLLRYVISFCFFIYF